MSNGYALAATTAVLRSRINSRLVSANVGVVVGTFAVSTGPPDLVRPIAGADPTQLNLFLHQVTPNPGQRNRNHPTRNAAGEMTDRPTLALDLHYLITAFGAQSLFAEVLIGQAALLLHEQPLLTRDHIRAALNPPLPATPPPAPIVSSGLDEQIEQIRIQPESITSEEMSRMWSALHAQYRPSIAYRVSVVLLESEHRPGPALPVRRRPISKAIPTVGARIASVASATGPASALTMTDSLVVEGEGFAVSGLQLLVGGVAHTPSATQIRASRIEVPLTDLASPPRPGLVPVQVAINTDLGDPPVPHMGLTSNVVAMPLAATFTSVLAPGADTTVDGVVYRNGQITLNTAPDIGRRQSVEILLSEIGAPPTRAARGYRFDAPAENGITTAGVDTTNSITFGYRGVLPGNYLLRLRVDGVDSPLGVDGSGTYSSPAVAF